MACLSGLCQPYHPYSPGWEKTASAGWKETASPGRAETASPGAAEIASKGEAEIAIAGGAETSYLFVSISCGVVSSQGNTYGFINFYTKEIILVIYQYTLWIMCYFLCL